jgi:putative MFS transporter
MLIGFASAATIALAGYFHSTYLGNLGKILGPLGLALIVGSTNYVSPKATVDAIFRALLYPAFWYALAACAFWILGIETRGRSIDSRV